MSKGMLFGTILFFAGAMIVTISEVYGAEGTLKDKITTAVSLWGTLFAFLGVMWLLKEWIDS